jgi:hypothetical protein
MGVCLPPCGCSLQRGEGRLPHLDGSGLLEVEQEGAKTLVVHR